MKRIFFPTDFSRNAHHAIEFGIEAFGSDVEEYILFNAYEQPHAKTGMLVSLNDILKKESEKGLNNQKAKIVNDLGIPEEKIITVSVLGDFVTNLSHYFKKMQADIVVMGTKGSSGLKEVLLGSNASAVIEHAKVPVLAVPRERNYRGMKNIVFAADLVINKSSKTLAPVRFLAKLHNSQVTLLNIDKKTSKLSNAEKEAGKKALKSELEGVETAFVFIQGEDTVESICGYLDSHLVDVLCMVHRKANFFEKLFTTSSVTKVANLAIHPLLSLPNE